MPATFNPGDVVELKSGSPKMTIAFVDDNHAFCNWYDPNTHEWRESVKFLQVVLKLS
jgi:uncharacterized protein YodC (DUF2158 family)